MSGLSVEVKLCRGDCSLVVSFGKFASPFPLAVEQTCASVEHYIFSRLERHEDGIRVVLPQSYAAKTSTVLNRRFLWRKWQAIVLLTKSDVGHHPYTLHSNQQGSSSR
jgi:hypothetical protein